MSSPSEPRATMIAIWRTRPTRRQHDRKIAGVAAAIARRYDIDPVLVRIGLVVAACYGVSILLYLAAWVALPPDPNDRPRGPLAGDVSSAHPSAHQSAHQPAHPVVLIAAVVACLAGAGSLISGDPGVLVGLAASGALLYLLHQARGERGLTADPAPPGGASVGTAVGTVAPAAPTPPPRRRSRITLVTLGLALLAGGTTAAIALPLAGVDGMRLVLGVMLAVVGLGLLVGSLRHSGRALIVAAIPLLLLGYGVTTAPMGSLGRGAGDLRVAPTTLAQLAPGYGLTLGAVTLDLRGLDRSGSSTVVPAPPGAAPPPGGTVSSPGQPPRTVVNLQVGHITVLMPPNVAVRAHCRAEIGNVNCLEQRGESDGPTQDVTANDLGADGAAAGRPLELDLLVRIGDVQVRRG